MANKKGLHMIIDKVLTLAEQTKTPQYLPGVSTITAPAYYAVGLAGLVESIARTIFHAIAALVCKIKKDEAGEKNNIALRDAAFKNVQRSFVVMARSAISVLPFVGNYLLYYIDSEKAKAKLAKTITQKDTRIQQLQERLNKYEPEVVVVEEKKDAVVVEEKKDVVVVEEKKDAVVVEEKKDAIVIEEKKDGVVVEEKIISIDPNSPEFAGMTPNTKAKEIAKRTHAMETRSMTNLKQAEEKAV